jgi:chemotaxis protein methyltransferase CheR
MKNAAHAVPLERFRALVARRLGLRFDQDRSDELMSALQRLAGTGDRGPEEYLRSLEHSSPPRDRIRAVVGLLTVGETYFFRHPEQFRAFADLVSTEAPLGAAAPRTFRVLSAGCASGEEPYSLAMTATERLAGCEMKVAVTAIDINPASLERARRGRFSAWSLRETPEDARRRWFSTVGAEYEVDPSIRAVVGFAEANLAETDPALWAPEGYDVVFCRNVLMYFTPEAARDVIRRIAFSLAPGGHLFLGHAESLRELSSEFELCYTHGTFYYRKRAARTTEAPDPRDRGAASSVPAPPPDRLDAPWFEIVREATERIRLLSQQSGATSDARAPEVPASHLATEVADLMSKERFAEALDLVERLPREAAGHPDALLLRAVLLAHRGRFDDAERICFDLRSLDARSAGAHYVLALCRENAGDGEGAMQNDLVATYLDPDFAMPHLHAGLLARRAGDRETARRQLRKAIALLLVEEEARVRLFGGGFTRAALIGLCRAELDAAGGAP